jgi:hypothetical protein
MIWQPIATAPKDGTWVLLYDCIHECSVIGKYKYSAMPPGKYGRFIWFLQEDAGSLAEKSVTHWMPLPAPPSPTSTEDKG